MPNYRKSYILPHWDASHSMQILSIKDNLIFKISLYRKPGKYRRNIICKTTPLYKMIYFGPFGLAFLKLVFKTVEVIQSFSFQ